MKELITILVIKQKTTNQVANKQQLEVKIRAKTNNILENDL